MIHIRQAVEGDIPAIVAMGRRMVATYGAGLVENVPQLEFVVRNAIASPNGVIWLAVDKQPVGFLVLIAFKHHLSGVATAGEVGWWVEPEARGCGIRLMHAAEQWAAEHGIVNIQMIAPNERVGALYKRCGYEPIEITYQRTIEPKDTGLYTCDGVLGEALAEYRAAAYASTFQSVEVEAAIFRGIGFDTPPTVPAWIENRYGLIASRSIFRCGPAGQPEPHYIHTDVDMGDWTGILYLTETPAEGDGTIFWRAKETGQIRSFVEAGTPARTGEALTWPELDRWEPWFKVEAKPDRLVLFPSSYFHSRALVDNYGEGEHARLVQVTFGPGAIPF